VEIGINGPGILGVKFGTWYYIGNARKHIFYPILSPKYQLYAIPHSIYR
jgi:hypothetical protein